VSMAKKLMKFRDSREVDGCAADAVGGGASIRNDGLCTTKSCKSSESSLHPGHDRQPYTPEISFQGCSEVVHYIIIPDSPALGETSFLIS
jgi:hypothetical protein